MNETEIKWYSINLDQKIEEHEPIDLKRAIEIADQYLARGNEKFKDDREAIAATMFGFSKSKSNFIEICINGSKQISYKFEFSNPDSRPLERLWRPTLNYEDELHSRDKLIRKITDFFSYSSEQLVQQNKSRKSRNKRSLLGNPPDARLGVRIFTIILFFPLGLFMTCSALHGIADAKIWWPSRYSHGRWIYENRNPNVFWIWVAIYFAISIWMIYGSLREIAIVKKMLKKRREKKLN